MIEREHPYRFINNKKKTQMKVSILYLIKEINTKMT